MFLIIAILILVIACINYVNLSTSRSMLRAKEVSLRKIVGAGKAQLFSQFIVETTILFCFRNAAIIGTNVCAPARIQPAFRKRNGHGLFQFPDLEDHHLYDPWNPGRLEYLSCAIAFLIRTTERH